jgi:WD40 repeat protein
MVEIGSGVVAMEDNTLKELEKSLLSRKTSRTASCLAFSPDAKLLAVGTRDNFISIWDVQKGAQIQGWEAKPGNLDGMLKFIQEKYNDNERVSNLMAIRHFAAVNCLSFGSGGIFLAAGLAMGDVQLWNISGNLVKEWPHKDEKPISSLRMFRDSIAYVHKKGLVIKRTLSDEDPYLIELETHLFESCPLEFSRDGNYLTVATDNEWHFIDLKQGTVRKWSLIEPFYGGAESETVRSLLWESDIKSLCWHPSGDRIAIGTSNGCVESWVMSKDSQDSGVYFDDIRLLQIDIGSIFDMCFAENNLLLASRKENDIYLWKQSDGNMYKIAYDCKQNNYPSVFSQDATLFAMGLDDGDVCVWQTDGKLLSKMNLRA